MNKHFYIFCVLVFSTRCVQSQYFYTTDLNKVKDFTYTSFCLKALTGLALPMVDKHLHVGTNNAIGISGDYYVVPNLAVHGGIDFELIAALRTVSDQTYEFERNKLVLVENKYLYTFTYTGLKIPLGIVIDQTNTQNRGWIWGTGIYLNINFTTDINIEKNGTSNFSLGVSSKESQMQKPTAFTRFSTQYYVRGAYSYQRVRFGIETSIGLSDLLSKQDFSAYIHNLSAFILYELRKL